VYLLCVCLCIVYAKASSGPAILSSHKYPEGLASVVPLLWPPGISYGPGLEFLFMAWWFSERYAHVSSAILFLNGTSAGQHACAGMMEGGQGGHPTARINGNEEVHGSSGVL
jgi:hypothetical protein